MESVKKHSYQQLISILKGKTVRFTSDCQFFPEFDVSGKTVKFEIAKNGELIIYIKSSSRLIPVGYNMKNLLFDIIQ